MKKFKVSYTYRLKGNNSGGTQATKTVQSANASSAVSAVKSEIQMKGCEFFLKQVVEVK